MKLKGRLKQDEPLCDGLVGIIIVTLLTRPAEWDTEWCTLFSSNTLYCDNPVEPIYSSSEYEHTGIIKEL